MREANVLRVMSSATGMRADNATGAMLQMRFNHPPPSIESSSVHVGNLVKRAMTFFDTNREAAWRCLSDESTLLGTEPARPTVDTPPPATHYRPCGLATWQAKRTLDYI